jgi:hypothetical protein
MPNIGAKMLMITREVNIVIDLAHYRDLIDTVMLLPERFRPEYFTVGDRVYNKERSRIDDSERFEAFLAPFIKDASGIDLIGPKKHFMFIAGASRNAQHWPTHMKCSVSLKGKGFSQADALELLRLLCAVPGVTFAQTCHFEEWLFRHRCIKWSPFAIQCTIGTDNSFLVSGLYWWTVLSDELVARHHVDLAELEAFAHDYQQWRDGEGGRLHAFRLYDAMDDWQSEAPRISSFLEAHANFFSMTRLWPQIEATTTRDAFDAVIEPYRSGKQPWEVLPPKRL